MLSCPLRAVRRSKPTSCEIKRGWSSIDVAYPVFAAGPESLDVRLFGADEIPWEEIAFPSVHWALHHEHEAQASGDFSTRCAPPDPSFGIGE